MATYERRESTVRVTRVEYTLPTGTHWTEVEKAIAAIRGDTKSVPEAHNARIEARDDEVAFVYEREVRDA